MDRAAVAVSWFRKNIRARFARGSFARNVAVLAGGTALGQVITVLASPILTRLYTPEDFGALAVYSSILGILSVVASWRYELAIPLPEEEEDAIHLLALSLGIVALMSLLTSLGTWILGDQIVRWTKVPALRSYLWLLPIGVLLVGSYQVFNYWAVRKQAFGVIARTKLNQGMGATLTQIALGILKQGPIGLLLGQIVGQSAGIITLSRIGFRGANVQMRNVGYIARKYRRFPLLSVWPAFINSVGLQLPIFALAMFFGPQVTGWFSLANKLLGIPLSIISTSTSQVLVGQAAEYKRSGSSIMGLFWKTIRQQVLLALPMFAMIPLCPFLFSSIFGPNWRESGIYAAIWLPALVANFIASPTGGILDVLERQELFLFRELLRLVFLGGVMVIAIKTKPSPTLMIGIVSTAMVIFAFFYAVLSLYSIKRVDNATDNATL